MTQTIPHFPFELPLVKAVSDVDALIDSLDLYQPRVAHGLASEWRLSKKLLSLHQQQNIDTAAELFGEKELRYTQLGPEKNGGMGIGEDLKPNFKIDDASLPPREFLSLAREMTDDQDGNSVYAAAMLLRDYPNFSALMPSIETIKSHKLWNQLIWVGSGGHIVDLHYDQMHNFITMFSGKKRITLFPPSALPWMYPAPLHRKVGGVPRSMVKLLDLDIARYPNFPTALEQAQQVVLEAGDVLYIPPLWWHCVESFGFNLMINSWYTDSKGSDTGALGTANETLHSAIIAASKINLQSTETAEALSLLDTEKSTASSSTAIQQSRQLASQPALRAWLVKAQQELKLMSPYWRDWYILQYKYYVLKTNGDPYPTLPDALDDFVRYKQKSKWNKNPALAYTVRVMRRIKQKARHLLQT